jgi:hypothetical protein
MCALSDIAALSWFFCLFTHQLPIGSFFLLLFCPGIFRPPNNNSDEYLNYAMANRNEWAKRGHEIVDEMAERFNEHAYLSAE